MTPEREVIDLSVIERVLRVHSGEDFEAGDFPTFEEGRAAWAMFKRLQDAVVTQPDGDDGHTMGHA
jgi:hypothetical protein